MSVIIDKFSWEHPDNEEYVRLKVLSLGDEHFSTMEELFYDGWTHPYKAKPKIQAIFKILSPNWSFKQYHRHYAMAISPESLRKKNPGNEQFLFHGTNRFCRLGEHNSLIQPCSLPTCNLCSIIRDSFDMKRCGTKHDFRRFGDGIYTTVSSSKADDYVLNGDESLRFRVLLVSRVVVGKPHKRRQNATWLTKPPYGLDSVVGEPGVDLNYEETVVYDNDAIRPAFFDCIR